MTTSPGSIAFHVGAHKTATSHLQRCLMKGADRLAAQGVRYYGPDYFRQRGHAIRWLFGFRDDQPIKSGQPSGAAKIAQMADGAKRLLLSEENYLGPMNDPDAGFMAQRYPEAGKRVGMFAQAVGQDVDVLIGLRQPSTYLNGAYGQMLLSGQRCDFDTYCRNNPLEGIDWAQVIAQLRAAKGVGQVIVWRYEDYAQVFDQVVGHMVGLENVALVPRIKRRINPGLSTQAVAAVRAGSEDLRQRYGLRDQFCVTGGHTPFDGFTPEDHAASAAAYDAQITAIANMDGVTFLRP